MFKDNLRPWCIYNHYVSYKNIAIMFKDNLRPGCIYSHYVSYKTMGYRKLGFWTKAGLYLNQIKLNYSH